MDTQLIQTVLIYALPVLFAITVHEAAHGYAARHFGDNTAYMLGRITLNPVKHIDPVGTIVIPLLMYLFTPYVFGYAKPVPVNFGNLRRPKRDMIWVALAGPGANLVQALLWGIIFVVLLRTGADERFFREMCQAGLRVNVALFVFNLLPLPPLDGGRVLVGLLPYRQAVLVSRIEPWGFFVVLALVATHVLDDLWMRPVTALTATFIRFLLSPLEFLFH